MMWNGEYGTVTDVLDAPEFFDVLSDEYTREILAAASVEPMAARELVDRFDISKPTVYRRLDRLEELDMIAEEMRLDPDGNHYRVFTATFRGAEIALDDGRYDVTVHLGEDVGDRFTRLWDGIRRTD